MKKARMSQLKSSILIRRVKEEQNLRKKVIAIRKIKK
jgi:hypothetical protein